MPSSVNPLDASPGLERAFDNWYSSNTSAAWYEESELSEEGAFIDDDESFDNEPFDHRNLVSDDAVDIQLWRSLHSPDTDAPMDFSWQRSR